MEFGAPAPRRRIRENIVPMINVVFLLLIFFLMTAQFLPPAPFEVAPPVAEGDARADGLNALYVTASGEFASGELRGEAALAALAARPEDAPPLIIRAEATLPGAEMARLLARLSALGVAEVRLVTVRP